MSVAGNATAVIAALAEGGTTGDISFVPLCSSGISFQAYNLDRANKYDPADWDYYKATPSGPPPVSTPDDAVSSGEACADGAHDTP